MLIGYIDSNSHCCLNTFLAFTLVCLKMKMKKKRPMRLGYFMMRGMEKCVEKLEKGDACVVFNYYCCTGPASWGNIY